MRLLSCVASSGILVSVRGVMHAILEFIETIRAAILLIYSPAYFLNQGRNPPLWLNVYAYDIMRG